MCIRDRTQALQAGGRKDRAVEPILLYLADAGLDVPADVHYLETPEAGEELGTATQTARADAPSRRQARGRLKRTHEHIGWILTLREREEIETFGQRSGHVLGAVHSQVCVTREERLLDLLHEKASVPDLGERRVEDLVPAGDDLQDSHLEPGLESFQKRLYVAALRHGQPAPTRCDDHTLRVYDVLLSSMCSAGAPAAPGGAPAVPEAARSVPAAAVPADATATGGASAGGGGSAARGCSSRPNNSRSDSE